MGKAWQKNLIYLIFTQLIVKLNGNFSSFPYFAQTFDHFNGNCTALEPGQQCNLYKRAFLFLYGIKLKFDYTKLPKFINCYKRLGNCISNSTCTMYIRPRIDRHVECYFLGPYDGSRLADKKHTENEPNTVTAVLACCRGLNFYWKNFDDLYKLSAETDKTPSVPAIETKSYYACKNIVWIQYFAKKVKMSVENMLYTLSGVNEVSCRQICLQVDLCVAVLYEKQFCSLYKKTNTSLVRASKWAIYQYLACDPKDSHASTPMWSSVIVVGVFAGLAVLAVICYVCWRFSKDLLEKEKTIKLDKIIITNKKANKNTSEVDDRYSDLSIESDKSA